MVMRSLTPGQGATSPVANLGIRRRRQKGSVVGEAMGFRVYLLKPFCCQQQAQGSCVLPVCSCTEYSVDGIEQIWAGALGEAVLRDHFSVSIAEVCWGFRSLGWRSLMRCLSDSS